MSSKIILISDNIAWNLPSLANTVELLINWGGILFTLTDIVGEIYNIQEELGKELSLDESTALLVEARQILMDIADRTAPFIGSQVEADIELG